MAAIVWIFHSWRAHQVYWGGTTGSHLRNDKKAPSCSIERRLFGHGLAIRGERSNLSMAGAVKGARIFTQKKETGHMHQQGKSSRKRDFTRARSSLFLKAARLFEIFHFFYGTSDYDGRLFFITQSLSIAYASNWSSRKRIEAGWLSGAKDEIDQILGLGIRAKPVVVFLFRRLALF